MRFLLAHDLKRSSLRYLGLPAMLLLQSLIALPARAEVIVHAEFDSVLPSLEVELYCGGRHPYNRVVTLDRSGRHALLESDEISRLSECRVAANLPIGYTATYLASEEARSAADDEACEGFVNKSPYTIECRITVTQDPVEIMVYKKWIGASGDEQNVRISLECESGDYSGYRYINEGAPDGWEIRNIPADGILCNVSELVRDNFKPDIIDCQGLYVLPGKGEECTLVNTKVVKRIEVLNRYGKVVMITLILAAGLVAMRRFT